VSAVGDRVKESVRILVADDNEDHLFLTVRALRDLEGVRLEVDTVRDGEEALDYMYRRGRFEGRALPHLILLDLKMPKVNGFEVLEQLKTDEELRSIPTVVLSSSERPEDVSETYRLGGNCYVMKPGSAAGLRDGLRRMGQYWTALASLPNVD
jgi:CheY-like chemotaxis protein